MAPVDSGGVEVDRCGTCGAIWFDPGEIRELTEGRLSFPVQEEEKSAPDVGTPMVRMHRLAASLSCPRCGAVLSALDFQATGVPVIVCSTCRGFLVPRGSTAKIYERFAFTRGHAALYAAMGESMASEIRKTLNLKYLVLGNAEGTTSQMFAIPVVVPLSTDAPPIRLFPAATWTLLGIPVILMILSSLGGVSCRLPWSPGGLPSGTGLSGAPLRSLLAYPFLPGGLLPLIAGVLFLFVLGRPVEERIGWMPFVGLYLFGAIVSGVAHMMAGRVGAPVALGTSGAVAVVLGAYIVFFPNVPIRMFGMGRIVSMPAYMVACCWALAMLFANPETGGMTGWLLRMVDPTPLSLWGSLAGFVSGTVFGAVARSHEEGLL